MKKLYIFAGVNGAGKSTFYVNRLETQNFDSINYGARVNSDELVRDLGDWKSQKDQNRAARLALRLRKIYLEKGTTFNVETTLCGHSIVSFIQKASECGYEVTLFYVGLKSVELSKQRVAIRVAKNGHAIDEATLERRFSQSFENLAKVLPFCEHVYFYDNSEMIIETERQNFSNLKFVAEIHRGVLTMHTDEEILWFKNVLSNLARANLSKCDKSGAKPCLARA